MNRLPLLALAMMAAAGCADAPQVKATISVAALKAAEPKTSRANVSVDVKPIAFTEIQDQRPLLQKIVWMEIDRGQAVRAGHGSSVKGTGIVRNAIVPVMPLPLFVMRIVNHSGKPLDFEQAQLHLVDDKGKRFDVYSDLGAVLGRVQDDIIATYPMMQQQQKQFELLGDVIARTRILGKKTHIDDGGDWQGVLLFKMDMHAPDELDKYLQSVGKLSIELACIGGDAQPMQIEVPLEKATAQLAVSCPATKPQSLGTCKADPLHE